MENGGEGVPCAKRTGGEGRSPSPGRVRGGSRGRCRGSRLGSVEGSVGDSGSVVGVGVVQCV